jgi:mitofusin
VDISLIDSPGLNIDGVKTMALFSQQEEIDVVVFVVNAENHFTLSGREFLQMAGKEKVTLYSTYTKKSYIFIVVNRFDMIKRRVDRCRKDILDQIQEISPQTFTNADTLVHFVSAKQCLQETPDDPRTLEDFLRLEDCLRSFVMDKRSKSKLAPARQYLLNLLGDVLLLADGNIEECERDIKAVQMEIEGSSPSYRTMLDLSFHLEDSDSRVDATCDEINVTVYNHLTDFLDNIDYVADDMEWYVLFLTLGLDYFTLLIMHEMYGLAFPPMQSG